MRKVLVIDNYDSFTYNLVQYIGTIKPEIIVRRNDAVTIEEIEDLDVSHIVISPGPGYPKNAGISLNLIKHFYKKVPILGVCLGHQAIGEAFGCRIIHASKLFHGKSSKMRLYESKIFKDIPKEIEAARYHSLIIDNSLIPESLKVIANTKEGEVMGIEHKDYPVFGVQFHPESIISKYGLEILKNFLQIN